MRSLFWNGFTRYASAPASRACSTRSRCENAVRISTAARRSPAIWRAAERPSRPGHLDVEDREVGLELADELDRLVAAAGLADDVVALLLEELLEVEADDRLVLGDDDAGGRVGGSTRVRPRAQRAESSADMRSSSASCSRSSSRDRSARARRGGGPARRRGGGRRGPRRRRAGVSATSAREPGVLGLLLEERELLVGDRRARRAGRLSRSLTSTRRRSSRDCDMTGVYARRSRGGPRVGRQSSWWVFGRRTSPRGADGQATIPTTTARGLRRRARRVPRLHAPEPRSRRRARPRAQEAIGARARTGAPAGRPRLRDGGRREGLRRPEPEGAARDGDRRRRGGDPRAARPRRGTSARGARAGGPPLRAQRHAQARAGGEHRQRRRRCPRRAPHRHHRRPRLGRRHRAPGRRPTARGTPGAAPRPSARSSPHRSRPSCPLRSCCRSGSTRPTPPTSGYGRRSPPAATSPT